MMSRRHNSHLVTYGLQVKWAGGGQEAAAGDPRRHNRDAGISRGGEEPSTNTL